MPLKSGQQRRRAAARRGARRTRRRNRTDTVVNFNGQPGTFIGIFPTPAANPLDTAGRVIDELPNHPGKPAGRHDDQLVYDSTETISASIEEVFKTIAEAVAIVIVVILLFLGSFRSVLMPVVTIPLSLIGVCFMLFCWAIRSTC
jgi:multidrug efflux pump